MYNWLKLTQGFSFIFVCISFESDYPNSEEKIAFDRYASGGIGFLVV